MRTRHSFVRPLLATILVLTLLLTMNPALVYGTQINSYDYQAQGLDRPDLVSYEQAKKKGHILRVPAMENESTFVFRNINGTLTSYTYGVKVQERDKNGKLKAIDLDFLTKKDLQDKVTGYTLANNTFQVGLPSELGNGQGLSVKTDRLALTMTPIRPDGADQTLAPGQLKKVQDYNGKLSYPGALGKDSAIEYSSTLTGLKEEIILSKAPADPVLRFRITAEGAAARLTETGAVEFYDPKNLASLGRIPEPYAMDSFKGKRVEGDGHYTEAIKVSLVEAAPGEWVYGLAVDEAFLYSPKTVYPIVIDPSVTISGSVDIFDTYASSGTPTIYYYNTDKMYVGKDSSLLVCRGYTKFNLASLTSADALMVTDAQYVNQEYLGYTTTCYIRLYQVTSAWTSGTLNWNNQPSIGSTIIDSKLVNGAGIYSFNVTTLVENWFLNARGLGGYAANGFTLRSDREGSIVLRKFRSSEATTNPPYLAITYTAVDRTAPNAPTGLTPTYFKHPDYNGSVQLSASWNAATDLPELNGSGIKNYEIDIKRADGTVLLSDTTTATSYTTTAYFDDNTTYTFDVRAVDNATDVYGAGIYNESGNATATLDVPDCEKPTIAYAAFDPDNWTAADTGMLFYTISDSSGLQKLEYWFTEPVTTVSSPANGSSQAPIDISGLDNGIHTLYYRFTDNQNNPSAINTAQVRIDRVNPNAPTLSLAGKTGTSVSLSWVAPQDSQIYLDYQIYRDGIYLTETSETTYTANSLKQGTQYQFTVRARDWAANLSPDSNAIKVTTLQRFSGQEPLHQSADLSIVGGTAFSDLQTGNLNYVTEDLKLPEWPFDLSVARHYNSRTTTGTLMGQGWDLSLNLYLQEEFAAVSDTIPQTVTFKDHQGTYWSFTVKKDGGSVIGYAAPLGSPYQLTKVNGLYQLTDDAGIQHRFNNALKLETALDQPYLVETSETVDTVERLKSVLLTDRSGRINWTFNANWVSGNLTGFSAADSSCPFTLVLNGSAYVLTETANTNHTYAFEADNATSYSQTLSMTTEIPTGWGLVAGKLTFSYSANNRLSGVSDQAGHAISLAYDTQGRVQAIEDLAGRKLSYIYMSNNVLSEASRLDHYAGPGNTNPVYAITRYTYDGNGYLASITDPDSVNDQLSFDSQGRLISHASLYSDSTDAAQLQTKWRLYDLLDYGTNMTTVRTQLRKYERAASATEDTLIQTERLGKTVYAIDAVEKQISSISIYPKPTSISGQNLSDESDYNYGTNPLRVISLTYADSSTDSDDFIDAVTRTTSDFDAETPNLTEESGVSQGYAASHASFYPAATGETNVYDLSGRLIITCASYANHGTAGHLCDQTAFTLAGRAISEKTRKGLDTTYEYDASGRVKRTIYTDKHVSTHYYGYVSTPQSPFTKAYFVEFEEDFGLNYFLETHFDAQKQKVYEEIRNCGDWLSLTYTYNGLGQKKTQTDKAGNVTTYVYNTNGDILNETIDQVTGPDLVTSRTYNGDFALLTETDPYGNTTVYTYETSGEKRMLTKSTTVNGETTTESYDYTLDANGQHTLTTTDPYNKTTITKLDANDKTLSISRAVSGLYDGTAIQNTYSYNSKDQLETIGHNGFFYKFTYDTDGNIEQIKVSDGTSEQTLLTKSKTENSDGSTTNIDAFTNGQSVSVINDNQGRTQKIQYNGTDRYSFVYSSDDTSSNDLDGQEVTTIIDTASGRKTVAKKSDDADSFDQSIVVTDSTTMAQLYTIGVVNTESAITLTTNIALTDQSYVYAKDTHGRLYQTSYTLPDTTSVQKNDAFGDLGQLTGSTLSINGVNRLQKGYSYKNIQGISFTNQVETETIQAGASSTSYGYSYDKLGNITKITKTDGGVTSDLYRFVYDEASQLVREDNTVTNQTTIWQYDKGGNIKNKKIFALTAEGVNPDGNSTLIDDIPYEYGMGLWKDQLTSYDGQSIGYDPNDYSGNPTTYLGATLTWTMGRQLESYTKPGLSVQYTYNEQGIRTSKTVNGVRTDYYLNGSQVIAEVSGSNRIDYRYDGSGKLIALRYNGIEYYYVINGLGDIIGLVDGYSNLVVQYYYDVCGKLLSTSGSMAATLGAANPYRYRGYRNDTDTEFYYLLSRYYDSNIGRFLNADELAILMLTNEQIVGTNLFAYCQNNYLMKTDHSGYYSFYNWIKFVNLQGDYIGRNACVQGIINLILTAAVVSWSVFSMGFTMIKYALMAQILSVNVSSYVSIPGIILGLLVANGSIVYGTIMVSTIITAISYTNRYGKYRLRNAWNFPFVYYVSRLI